MIRFRLRRASRFPFVESGSVSNETFGKSRKRRTSPVGSDKKQRTLFQPCAPSCKDNSRANISVPPMRRGATPNTDTSVRLRRGGTFVEVVCIIGKSVNNESLVSCSKLAASARPFVRETVPCEAKRSARRCKPGESAADFRGEQMPAEDLSGCRNRESAGLPLRGFPKTPR